MMKSNALDALTEQKVMSARPAIRRSQSVRYQSNSYLINSSDDSVESDADSVSDISLDSFLRDNDSITDESDEDTVMERSTSFRNSDPSFSQNMMVVTQPSCRGLKKEKKKRKKKKKALYMEDLDASTDSINFDRTAFARMSSPSRQRANDSQDKAHMQQNGIDNSRMLAHASPRMLDTSSRAKAKEYEDIDDNQLSGHQRDLDFEVSTQDTSFLTGDEDITSKKKRKKKKSKKSKKKDNEEVDWDAVKAAKKDIAQGRRYSVDEGNIYPELSRGETKQFRGSGNAWLEGKYATSIDWKRDASGMTLQFPTPTSSKGKEKKRRSHNEGVTVAPLLGMATGKSSAEGDDAFDIHAPIGDSSEKRSSLSKSPRPASLPKFDPYSTNLARSTSSGSRDSKSSKNSPTESAYMDPSTPNTIPSCGRAAAMGWKRSNSREDLDESMPSSFKSKRSSDDASKHSKRSAKKEKDRVKRRVSDSQPPASMHSRGPPPTTPGTEKARLNRRSSDNLPPAPTMNSVHSSQLHPSTPIGARPVAGVQNRTVMDSPAGQSVATTATDASPGNGVNYFVLKLPTRKLSMHQRRNSIGDKAEDALEEARHRQQQVTEEDMARSRVEESATRSRAKSYHKDELKDARSTPRSRRDGRPRRRSSSVGAKTKGERSPNSRRSSSMEAPATPVKRRDREAPLNDSITHISASEHTSKSSKRRQPKRRNSANKSLASCGRSTTSDEGSVEAGRRRRAPSVTRSDDGFDIRKMNDKKSRKKDRRQSLGDKSGKSGGRRRRSSSVPRSSESSADSARIRPGIRAPRRRRSLNIGGEVISSGGGAPPTMDEPPLTPVRRKNESQVYLSFDKRNEATDNIPGLPQHTSPAPEPKRGGFLSRFAGLSSEVAACKPAPPTSARGGLQRAESPRDRGFGAGTLTFNSGAGTLFSKKYTPTKSMQQDKQQNKSEGGKTRQSYSEMFMDGKLGMG